MWRDLNCLTAAQRLWMAVFAAFSLVFSFIDFSALLYPELHKSPIQWKNDVAAGVALWKRILYLFSGIASFTGVISVVMAAKARISNFYWGVLNCIFYGMYAFAYGYSGDAQLNILFFLPLQFLGIWSWKRNEQIHSISGATWFSVAISVVGLWLGVYLEIPYFSRAVTSTEYVFKFNTAAHILDAGSTALSIVAQVLLICKCWEQWLLWIAVDAINIAMYAGVAYGTKNVSINPLVMWCFFFCNAVFGLHSWLALLKTDKQQKLAAVAEQQRRLRSYV
jgi:nicotinamide mononucleotide transporter PnuC